MLTILATPLGGDRSWSGIRNIPNNSVGIWFVHQGTVYDHKTALEKSQTSYSEE